MRYTKPSMEIIDAQAVQMIAESLIISDTTVDGANALTKEDADWNIWSDED